MLEPLAVPERLIYVLDQTLDGGNAVQTETIERQDELAGTASFMGLLDMYAFGSKDICELGGIPLKAFHNARTLGHIAGDRPPGRGGRSEFTGRQLIETVLLFRFLNLGVPLGRSTKLVQTITTNYLQKLQEEFSRDPRLGHNESRSDILVVTPSEEKGEFNFYITKAQHLDVGRISSKGAIIIPLGRMIIDIALNWFIRRRAPTEGPES